MLYLYVFIIQLGLKAPQGQLDVYLALASDDMPLVWNLRSLAVIYTLGMDFV